MRHLFNKNEYSLNEINVDISLYELRIRLKNIPLEKYFGIDGKAYISKNICLYATSICRHLNDYLSSYDSKESEFEIRDLSEKEHTLICTFTGNAQKVTPILLKGIRDYYETNAVHITRMFGSYILLSTANSGTLSAVYATDIPIDYCPLMFKLLKEVGGEIGSQLINAMRNQNGQAKSDILCRLINKVVINGGYFDTSRPLNSCEANVTFGASETISSAFSEDLVDAAVIVSNNLGTIITTNAECTQGAVKRMTGLFYTSPSEAIMQTAYESGIIPVFPYTAEIDQIAGVKKAIDLGYKKIAVTLASSDNILMSQLTEIERENQDITLFKFALCSTGISQQAAIAMKENADIVWSCASKQIIEYIEPYSLAQVGIKIPVHIMTFKGWGLVQCHLSHMNSTVSFDEVQLSAGEDKPVFLNDENTIRLIRKKDLLPCDDCPHPCV